MVLPDSAAGVFFSISLIVPPNGPQRKTPCGPITPEGTAHPFAKRHTLPPAEKTDKKTAQKSACAAKKARRLGWASRYVVCKQPKKKTQEVFGPGSGLQGPVPRTNGPFAVSCRVAGTPWNAAASYDRMRSPPEKARPDPLCYTITSVLLLYGHNG